MFILIYSKAMRAAALTAFVAFAAPAQAASATTFVSGAGANTGNCSTPATPCRTFAYALAQTTPGGEIRALDSANYSPVTIAKAVTITGVDGAGILRVNAGDAITVSGAAGRVLIQNLSFDGFGAATNAINVTSAAVVEIVKCSIRRFAGNGVIVRHASGTAEVFITGLLASNNAGAGVYFAPTGSGAISARLADVRLDNNSANGLYVDGGETSGVVQATVTGGSASGNTNNGFAVFQISAPPLHTSLFLDSVVADANGTGLISSGLAVARITRSSFIHNTVNGVSASGGPVESHGNNAIRGNATNVAGSLTPAGLQ